MTDTTDQLATSITSLGASIDRANLRLELTREALRAALGSEGRYRYVIAAIEEAMCEPVDLSGGLRVVGSLDGLVK